LAASDAELVQAARRGSQAAFQLIVERQQQAVRSFLRRAGLSASDAEAADVLRLPLGTIKSHVQRGRAKLLAALEGPGVCANAPLDV
jgi:DNA-directed RNA polymerase specialized sigma24 family protein